jgi:hypothetical protein
MDDEEKELRKISDEELEQILADHKRWLESEGKGGIRADLSNANLRKRNIPYALLKGADLQKTCLDGAFLWGARLEDANLSHAHLDQAILTGAHLEGAFLQDAHPNDRTLEALEAEAQAAHRGLWSQPDPVSPYRFRHKTTNEK